MAVLKNVDLDGLNPRVRAIAQQFQKTFPDFDINSGYRDPAHNHSVGGAGDSRHKHRDAFDFRPNDPNMSDERKEDAIKWLRANGVGGLGAYSKAGDNFHADWRDGPKVAWGANRSHTSLESTTPAWFARQANDHRTGVAVDSTYATVPPGSIPEGSKGGAYASFKPMRGDILPTRPIGALPTQAVKEEPAQVAVAAPTPAPKAEPAPASTPAPAALPRRPDGALGIGALGGFQPLSNTPVVKPETNAPVANEVRLPDGTTASFTPSSGPYSSGPSVDPTQPQLPQIPLAAPLPGPMNSPSPAPVTPTLPPRPTGALPTQPVTAPPMVAEPAPMPAQAPAPIQSQPPVQAPAPSQAGDPPPLTFRVRPHAAAVEQAVSPGFGTQSVPLPPQRPDDSQLYAKAEQRTDPNISQSTIWGMPSRGPESGLINVAMGAQPDYNSRWGGPTLETPVRLADQPEWVATSQPSAAVDTSNDFGAWLSGLFN